MATRMLQRRGTAAEWAAANPVLGAGEIGFETDTKILKLGDGVTAWNALTSPLEPYLLKTGKAADSELLDGLNSTAFMLATDKKTLRISHTFTITGEVKVASGDTSYIPPFFVSEISGQTATLALVLARLNSGTSATIRVEREPFASVSRGVLLGNTVVASGSGVSLTPTATSVAADDKLYLVINAVSGTPKNLSVSLYFDYTF